MVNKEECTLYSGGLKGAESAFGEAAEKWGVKEVAYSFADHKIERDKNIELSMTSMIDVVFLLLIFFMTTTYFQVERGPTLTLPGASHGKDSSREDAVVLLGLGRQDFTTKQRWEQERPIVGGLAEVERGDQ